MANDWACSTIPDSIVMLSGRVTSRFAALASVHTPYLLQLIALSDGGFSEVWDGE